jgi:hypothetical protein
MAVREGDTISDSLTAENQQLTSPLLLRCVTGMCHNLSGNQFHRQTSNIADYDNQVLNPYTADSGADPTKIRQGFITWSVGKDKKLGNSGDNRFANSDDVISWR